MTRSTRVAGLPDWFLVLPDDPAAATAAEPVRPFAGRVLDHPGGRPWLLGRWTGERLTTGTAGDVTVAVSGTHLVSPEAAGAAAERVRATGRVDGDVIGAPGSYHVIVRTPAGTYLRAGATEVRRVFVARTGPAPLAGDRADVLAALRGAALDPVRLALHLLDPQTLHPLAGTPVWGGIDAVPGGSWAALDRTGRVSLRRWWTPPEPVTPMAEAAPALRDALIDAVRVRTAGRPLVTADLGGLDSTAVCSVAARHGGTAVAAYTVDVHDPLGDDVRWAEATVAALGIEHRLVPAEDMPMTYDGLTGPAESWDEPCLTTVDRNRWKTLMRLAVERGSTVHLTGIGGDELLYGTTAHLHGLLRRRPRTAWRAVRGFAAKYRWPRDRTLRQLAGRGPYQAWLRRVADELTAPPPPLREPMLDWGSPPRLPPWTTPEAVAAVRGLIRAEAAGVTALAPGRGPHRELEAIRSLSRTTRQLRQMAAPLGLDYAAPYYDDRVVTAALRTDPADRITPWRYKPLIVEAMRGVVPEVSRERATKANAMVEEETGLRRHRDDLLALCDDSRLAGLGLIDAAAFRAACARPPDAGLQCGVLHQTLACEVWLRSLEQSTVPA
ncbi:asparagine synthase-related protein [Catenuloplanes atrovinosus]|uniref:asparagine synthase (glutamine-hydrolyzing) n=1 Tax=Catenuloplanes atrovinosus TaxID=137266 RepID=A0AAE3YPI7_9ACTN|nr:asparagine synthase-related protein [Catenuloplanes atrovinosus]MDR7276847.1 asparagine synthase (glutamine-hydrolyzing) [Catenuloplanes atrovinosus]